MLMLLAADPAVAMQLLGAEYHKLSCPTQQKVHLYPPPAMCLMSAAADPKQSHCWPAKHVKLSAAAAKMWPMECQHAAMP
jgi:hypothetical protein